MWSLCHEYMCTLLYVKPIGCNGVAGIYGQLEEGEWGHSGIGICAFVYMWNLLGMDSYVHSKTMHIYLWQSDPTPPHQMTTFICAFFSMWNFLGVMVLHRSMVNCRRRTGQNWCGVVVFHRPMVYCSMGGHLSWVYVHTATYETDVV